jgi:hypothetical protein
MWARGGWTPSFVTGVVVAAVLAAAGGFETGHIPLVPRFAYWIGLVMAGVVVAQLIRGRLARAPWFWRSRWLAAGAIAAGTTVPMTAVVGVSSAMIMGEPLRLARFYFVFPDVVAMAVGVTVLAVLVHGNGPAETRAAAGPDASGEVPPPKFLARLPPKLAGAALFAVEAQDHYLRLHTSKGQDLILMRLSDAIAELDGIEGARTHRSWWVARGAVVSAERAEGRATLTLTDGAQAPVSRSYVKPLREAGWF